MMNIELWCINKTSQNYVNEGMEIYTKRLKHYVKFGVDVINSPKNSSKLPLNELKKKEAQLVLAKLETSDHLILLDENGIELSSIKFATKLNKLSLSNFKRIVYLVGGGYGFDDLIYARANGKMSLSKMTFPHELVRIIFLEQLYRACTINKGEKYHHK